MKRAINPGDVRATDRGGNDGSTAWTMPMRPGSLENMYLEDSNFLYDSAYPTSAYTNRGDATIYANPEGGSIVIRHNVFEGYNVNYLDAHGDGRGVDSARLFEVYGNTFTRGTSGGGGVGHVGNARGGSWLVWGNTIVGYGGETFRLWNYCATNGHPVRDTYFWGNTVTPGPLMVSDSVHNSLCPSAPEPVLDRDYFLHSPAPGQTFHPYMPLVYPHPLVSD